jgi:hypothetical protein
MKCQHFFVESTSEETNSILIEISVNISAGALHAREAAKELKALETKEQSVGVEMRTLEIIL